MTRTLGRLNAVGVLTVAKFRQGEDQPYEVLSRRNSLVTEGKQHLLELGAGITSSNKLDAASVLTIKNSAGTVVKTLTGLETGYPQHSSGSGSASVALRWRDGSTDTYSAYTCEVFFAGGTIQLNTLSPQFGTKPTTEAWVYTFTLTFNVGSSALTVAGLDLFLKCITGMSANTFNASRTQLQVKTSSTGTTLLDWTASGSPVRSGDAVSWSWTVAAGVATGTWGYVSIRNSAGPVTLRAGASLAGDKTDLTQRTYTYSLTV